MTDRYQLIARKEEVRRRIERLRSRLEHEYGEEPVKRNRLVRTLEDEFGAFDGRRVQFAGGYRPQQIVALI